jgi:hypothetical protein
MEEAAEAGVTVVVEARRRAAALEVVAAEEEAALAVAGEAPTEEARTVEHFQLRKARPKTGAGFFLCRIFAKPLSSQLLNGTGVCKSREAGPFLIGHKEKAR